MRLGQINLVCKLVPNRVQTFMHLATSLPFHLHQLFAREFNDRRNLSHALRVYLSQRPDRAQDRYSQSSTVYSGTAQSVMTSLEIWQVPLHTVCGCPRFIQGESDSDVPDFGQSHRKIREISLLLTITVP